MYSYYACTAVSIPFPRFLKKSITRMQITQFLVGGSLAASYLFIKVPELPSAAETARAGISSFEAGVNALKQNPAMCLRNAGQINAVRVGSDRVRACADLSLLTSTPTLAAQRRLPDSPECVLPACVCPLARSHELTPPASIMCSLPFCRLLRPDVPQERCSGFGCHQGRQGNQPKGAVVVSSDDRSPLPSLLALMSDPRATIPLLLRLRMSFTH